MCGIIGAFGEDRDNGQAVRRHVKSLAHRGPDGQTVVDGEGFAFGHALLSIIGPGPIRQPITSSDGRVTLTYNGEIYNFVEIMRDHPELKARCTAMSDTQVLVEGLSLYGIDFIKECNGIFGFAAWDRKTRTGWIVRDRLGVKPVYYTQAAGQIWFASEARPLLEMSGASTEPDPEAFYSYARFRYPLGERTFFKSVKMIPPGNIVTIRDGKVTLDCYWDIQEPKPFTGSYEEARHAARELFLNAVEIQMRSDHSFCTYLSGGLDSSYLTAIARQNKSELDTYSIGLDAGEFDESEYSLQVARTLGTRHHPYLLKSEEYRQQHAEYVRHLGMPISVPNQVALKILSRELSRDHRVVLSGEGADEVFGGYGRIFLLPADWERLQKSGVENDSGRREFLRKIREQFGTDEWADYPSFFLRRYGYVTHEQAAGLMGEHFDRPSMDRARESVETDIRAMFGRWQTDLYTRQLLLFQKIHLPGLLMRVDTSTMAHHVEGRVPFLDHRVVELLNSFPIHYKMKRKESFDAAMAQGLTSDELSETHDIPKAPLKEMAEEIVPKEIVWRKKVGFPIPAGFYKPEEAGAAGGTGGSNKPSYAWWVERNMQLLTRTKELV